MHVEQPKVFRDLTKAGVVEEMRLLKSQVSSIKDRRVLVMVRWIGFDVNVSQDDGAELSRKFGKPIDADK